MAKRISVKLVKSTIGQRHHVRATVRSLGLKKLNSVMEHEANPAILGMVKTVSHIVEVKELN
ncbi:50S ribosomal protein L30 [Treponema pedis]|uniref:Large ribosomal subunit protein uL30 n=2 Tax=Treponema pedis TaxID=409322 RepID=S6A978_9SPIR|nr:50S ribosomal protein L30 [Treponema pedis]AGT45099.1 50S ribosomal protein L30 [Treponema pedis str. T A4]QOW60360.1 50S ribosomal protein L30 [Treponema pedis]QSI05700.1 50S ribosomal protein L30 [Treponema pedis]